MLFPSAKPSLSDSESYDLWGADDGTIFVATPQVQQCPLCSEWTPAYEPEEENAS